jgi:integrase
VPGDPGRSAAVRRPCQAAPPPPPTLEPADETKLDTYSYRRSPRPQGRVQCRVSILGWRVYFTKRRLPQPRAHLPLVGELGDLDRWLDERELLDDAPFLLGPDGSYDVVLNGYFTGTWLRGSPKNTQAAVAYDLKKWLDFLASSGDRPTWRDATTEDRAAFEQCRRKDPRGPRIASTTWDREVATVNGFYQWAVRQGHVARNPLVQRPSRARRRSADEPPVQTPAEASHLGPRRDLKWLTPAMYRSWRDVGVRGFTPDGLPDRSFRGRYASRNAAFTDLLIRTGLRISEQVALSLSELPELTHGVVNARTWLLQRHQDLPGLGRQARRDQPGNADRRRPGRLPATREHLAA